MKHLHSISLDTDTPPTSKPQPSNVFCPPPPQSNKKLSNSPQLDKKKPR